MTNTSDNQPEIQNKKKKKKKGPIRFEAIVPFTIFVAAVIIYFSLFFDTHLKWGMEYIFTQMNSAEVNISSVKTSFWKASFRADGLHFTNPKKPKENRFEIGKIETGMLWDALLRARIVIEKAAINGIKVNTPRKSEGYVLPPSEGSLGQTLTEAAKKSFRERFDTSNLEDLVAFFKGFNPQEKLKDLGKLKSVQQIDQISKDLSAKEKEWNEQIAGLSKLADFSDVQNQINAVKVQGGNPVETAKQIAKVGELVKGVEQKVETVKNTGNKLVADINGFEKSVSQIDNLIKEDQQNIESKLQLPKVDTNNLSDEFFGKMVVGRLEEVQKYTHMAKQYIPEKSDKTKQAEPIKPNPRAPGKVYQFGRQNSYPLFWLKRAEFDSDLSGTPYGGKVAGELLNATTSQPLINQPTTAKLSGEFPEQNIKSFLVDASLDHREVEAIDRFKIQASGFRVPERYLTQTDSIEFGWKQATGQAAIDVVKQGSGIAMTLDSRFRDIDYIVKTKSQILGDIFGSVTKSLPELQLKAKVSGNIKEPRIDIDSNLGAAIARGLQDQLKGKLNEAKARVKALIDEKVLGPKNQLLGRFNAIKSKALGGVQSHIQKADQVKSLANNKIEELKKSNSPANKAKGAGSKLKKKFGF